MSNKINFPPSFSELTSFSLELAEFKNTKKIRAKAPMNRFIL